MLVSHVHRNANQLSHTLQVAGEEITRQTLFRTFFMWGGPSSVPGTIDILSYVSSLHQKLNTDTINSAQTGCTLEGEEEFSSFLGPMFGELQEKFRQWLQLTYSM